MKNKTQRKPTAGKCSLLHQLCNLIPAHPVPRLARDTGVTKRARTFTPWSQEVTLLYAQLTHAIGHHHVCDACRKAELQTYASYCSFLSHWFSGTERLFFNPAFRV